MVSDSNQFWSDQKMSTVLDYKAGMAESKVRREKRGDGRDREGRTSHGEVRRKDRKV